MQRTLRLDEDDTKDVEAYEIMEMIELRR